MFFCLSWALEAGELSSFQSKCSDWQSAQHFFSDRPIVPQLKEYGPVFQEFKLIGKSSDETPEWGCVCVNSREDDRENCAITYASLNKNYPRGVRRLVETLAASEFEGHVRFRIGGWPDCSEEDVFLTQIPYAFKVAFFREVRKLGYKRALWMDASVLPVVCLNKVFSIIKNKGYYIEANTHQIGPFMNEEAARACGLTLQRAFAIPSCSSAIVGIDFTHPKGAELFHSWFETTKHPAASCSARPDQNLLSIILCQLGITDLWPLSKKRARKHSLFIIDRDFVKEK